MPRAFQPHSGLSKTLAGIAGFDAIIFGTIPRGRPTLGCVDEGCWKPHLAMGFLILRALQFAQPGAFMNFEADADGIRKHTASFGFDTAVPHRKKQPVIDYVTARRGENGEYNIKGLFTRVAHAVANVRNRWVMVARPF